MGAVDSLVLLISSGAVVPALATTMKAWLEARKEHTAVTVTVRGPKGDVKVQLNPGNADQAEEIIKKILLSRPPEEEDGIQEIPLGRPSDEAGEAEK